MIYIGEFKDLNISLDYNDGLIIMFQHNRLYNTSMPKGIKQLNYINSIKHINLNLYISNYYWFTSEEIYDYGKRYNGIDFCNFILSNEYIQEQMLLLDILE